MRGSTIAIVVGALVLLLLWTPDADRRLSADPVPADIGQAAALLGMTGDLGVGPLPGPVIPPAPVAKTHDRADCPTAGWVTHGDGHRTRCPDCVPAYGDEPATTPDASPVDVDEPESTPEPLLPPIALRDVLVALPSQETVCVGGVCYSVDASGVMTPLAADDPLALSASSACADGSCGTMAGEVVARAVSAPGRLISGLRERRPVRSLLGRILRRGGCR